MKNSRGEICDVNIKKAQEVLRKTIDVYKNGTFIGRFVGLENAARALEIDKRTIYNSLHGMTNRKGYAFLIVGEVV